jgi:hypothetical protein
VAGGGRVARRLSRARRVAPAPAGQSHRRAAIGGIPASPTLPFWPATDCALKIKIRFLTMLYEIDRKKIANPVDLAAPCSS